MEKTDTTQKSAKHRRPIDWTGLGIQVGTAALQGAIFALGGIAAQRLVGSARNQQSLGDNSNVTPIKKAVSV